MHTFLNNYWVRLLLAPAHVQYLKSTGYCQNKQVAQVWHMIKVHIFLQQMLKCSADIDHHLVRIFWKRIYNIWFLGEFSSRHLGAKNLKNISKYDMMHSNTFPNLNCCRPREYFFFFFFDHALIFNGTRLNGFEFLWVFFLSSKYL